MAEVSFGAIAPSAIPAPAPAPSPDSSGGSVPRGPAPAPAPAPVPAPAPAPAPVIDVQATVTSVTSNAVPAAAPAATTTALVPTAQRQLAVALSPTNVVTMDRIPGYDEIIWPRINIAQAIGDLGKTYPVGSIIYNQTNVLFEPTITDPKTGNVVKKGLPPINVVCLGFLRTRYVEKVSGGGRGMILTDERAVSENGGTLDYNEWNLKKASGMKRFEVLEEGLFAIERPAHIEDDGAVFVFPVEDKKYALAIYGMKGTAYTAAAKGVLFTQRASGNLREGYPSRVFAMTTKWKDFENGNGAWVPVLLAQKATTPTFREWAKSITNPQSLATAEGQATGDL